MPGLREKKKKEIKERILKSAREIFFVSGYEDTTIEQIANSAEIGVGTVYNYFKTKAEILISVVEEDVETEGFSYNFDDTEIEKGVVDIILDFTWHTMGKMKFLSKRIWRELFAAMSSSMKSDNKLIKGFSKIDFSYIDRLKVLLNDLKNKKILPEDFETDIAAMVIYDVVMTQTFLYIFEDKTSIDQLHQEIQRQLEFIFAGKSNWKDGDQ